MRFLNRHCAPRQLHNMTATQATFLFCTLLQAIFTEGQIPEPEPQFLAPLENYTVIQGRDVYFTCVVNNLGPYKVAWIKSDTKAILAIHTHMVAQNSRLSVTHNGHDTWKLHVTNVQKNDSGTYMCQINTDPMRSQMGNLEVVIRPDILPDNESTEGAGMAVEGGTIRLKCKASGVPEPTVLWRREDGNSIILRLDGGRERKGYKSYRYNITSHDKRIPEEILSVRYEDGKWSKPYYDCGGGNIWMLTYTVPFFGFANNTYFFKGTSGIDIDLRRVDIDQCPLPKEGSQVNIFAASDKCKKTTTCVPIPGLGFRRGSYKCVCRPGFFFPNTKADRRYYNGTVIEEEYEKVMVGESSQYEEEGMFECLPCSEGCESCEDERPCLVSLNWVMRTVILILSCVIICCLPIVVFFTWKYGDVKVVRAASPVLLRVIALGAFFIYSTMIVMYPRPTIYTCTARVWLREIGFSLTYGALMLKTWRISVIFRVRSAKAVKITDTNLLKRLGVILTIFTTFLIIRTLVAPPIVIVGRTADDLKAYLCRTDWWDHLFTTLEVLFLVWGIRLCIVVRKAPSEFNESRFISMAIYNEFLLSVFLNISMLFLQKPANPDLMYIIFFCHTQLTVTLLLCLIFGSKVFMVFKNKGRSEESSSMVSKNLSSKFISKTRSDNIQYSANSSTGGHDFLYSKYNEHDVQEEFLRVYTQLEVLRERNMRMGNRHLASKIIAMQDAARTHDNVQAENSQNPIKPSSSLAVIEDSDVEELSIVKIKHQTVSFAVEPKTNEETINIIEEIEEETNKISEECASSSTYPTIEVKTTESKTTGGDTNGRFLMSGHARTHSIVINLDDKSRFTDEITV